MGVDRVVFCHHLVGVEREARELEPCGLDFGEIHEPASESGALRGGMDGDIFDEEAVTC